MHGFLEHLQDNIQLAGMYEDADLSLQTHVAEISNTMIAKVDAMLQNIRWGKSNISDFLGRYLTEPKPDVIFEPAPKTSIDDLAKQLAQKPISLTLQSQMLFHQQQFYINGEPLTVPVGLVDQMQAFADHRSLDATSLTLEQQAALASTLHTALIAGYISF